MPTIEHVREFVHSTFTDLGAPYEKAYDETRLIRFGRDCGRRFNCDGLQAIWFMEENQFKFYDRNGSVVKVYGVAAGGPEGQAPKRMGQVA